MHGGPNSVKMRIMPSQFLQKKGNRFFEILCYNERVEGESFPQATPRVQSEMTGSHHRRVRLWQFPRCPHSPLFFPQRIRVGGIPVSRSNTV